jgi:hypothetical protein
MRVTRISCDNPKCKSTGIPEWEDEKDPTNYSPPFAWWYVEGNRFGPGPSIQVECCSVKCISLAITEKWRALDDQERR